MMFKPCTCCGRPFAHDEWDALPKLANGLDDGVEFLELANCPSCNSTLAIVLWCHVDAREQLEAEERQAA